MTGVTPLTDHAWYHAAATYDGTTWRLYLDGDARPRRCVVRRLHARGYDSIQHAGPGHGHDLHRRRPRATSTACSTRCASGTARAAGAEIAADANTQITTNESGLVARYALDDGGATVTGTGSNPVTGTISGNPKWIAGAPFNLVVNAPPPAPTNPAPADGATGVATSATLSVDVAPDADGDPLSVTFYGRPVAPATGDDFTLAVLPDTQYYSATYPTTSLPRRTGSRTPRACWAPAPSPIWATSSTTLNNDSMDRREFGDAGPRDGRSRDRCLARQP